MTLIPIPLPTPETKDEWIRDAVVLIEQQRGEIAEANRQKHAALDLVAGLRKERDEARADLRSLTAELVDARQRALAAEQLYAKIRDVGEHRMELLEKAEKRVEELEQLLVAAERRLHPIET